MIECIKNQQMKSHLFLIDQKYDKESRRCIENNLNRNGGIKMSNMPHIYLFNAMPHIYLFN